MNEENIQKVKQLSKAAANAKKASTFSKFKQVILTLLQTLITVIVALILTIIQCGFDFKKFNWLRFAMNFLFTTYMKAVYTNYAKEKEQKENKDIIILRNTIEEDRKEIYNKKKTEDFEAEVERINQINMLEIFINDLDNKIIKGKNDEKIKKEREWAFNYRQALLSGKDITELERERSVNSISKKVKYEKIEASKLWTYGQNSKSRSKKYTFSSFGSSLNRAIIPTTVTLVISVLFGVIDDQSGLKEGRLWIDLASYMASIGLGIWWGVKNGESIMEEDYLEVLNNVASLVREIKVKILPEQEIENKVELLQ